MKLGSFRIFARGRLGSFRIFRENPEVRMQNPGEGGTSVTCVLSDGGFVDTGF